MILSDAGILRYMAGNEIVFAGPDGRELPYQEIKQLLNPNSINVRLGTNFAVVTYPLGPGRPEYYGFLEIEPGQRVYLPPGDTVLAHTHEVVGARNILTTQIHARSTTRRRGISICDDAGFGDVGFICQWTVELTANVHDGCPFLVVGDPFAQISFMHVSEPPLDTYSGQYTGFGPLNMIPKADRDNVRPMPPALEAYMRTGDYECLLTWRTSRTP